MKKINKYKKNLRNFLKNKFMANKKAKFKL